MTELSQDALRLIDETRHSTLDAASADDRERMRRKLVAELGAAAFAGVTLGAAAGTLSSASSAATALAHAPMAGAAAAAKASFGLTLAKVGLALALLGAVGGVTFVLLSSRGPELGMQKQPVQPAALSVQASAPRVVTPSPEPAAVEAPRPALSAPSPQESSGEPAIKPLRRKRAAPPRVEPEPAQPLAVPADPRHLTEELSLIGRAQAALRQKRPAEARAALAEHARRFPQGAMREERLGLSAIVRCAEGEAGDAVVRAFSTAAPTSPLLRRVREACGVK